MKIAVEIQSEPSQTVRAKQLAAAFDVPLARREMLRWNGQMPIEDKDWSVGLIVGPSGSGKSTILRECFSEPREFQWGGDAVADDFPAGMSIEDITSVCQAVGFNTIPAWLRPYTVLSNGEQFRVRLARTLVESTAEQPISIDEFTSVVDRQVAKIGAHAAQKWVRRNGRQLVCATCHYDVTDWLRPDWVLEPATMTFEWKEWERRPPVDCTIARVPHAYWRLFAPFHYLTAELHKGAACYVLFAGEEQQPAAFCGVLHRPHASNKSIKGVSRLVTLPDWQGLGLAFALADRIGAAYDALGYELRTYPAHPALIRSFDRSPIWELKQKPGSFTGAGTHPKSTLASSVAIARAGNRVWRQGGRPCAVFRYRGEAMDARDARRLVG